MLGRPSPPLRLFMAANCVPSTFTKSLRGGSAAPCDRVVTANRRSCARVRSSGVNMTRSNGREEETETRHVLAS